MSKEVLVSQFFVAGLVFGDYANAKLKRGQRVSLVKEPTNVHDRSAIQVNTPGGIRLGFVPRAQTHEIHRFQGKIRRAVIHAFEPQSIVHRRVLVNVYGAAANPVDTNVICS